jgi:hypothetical protein
MGKNVRATPPEDGAERHQQSPREQIVDTVRAWFRRNRRRQAA